MPGRAAAAAAGAARAAARDVVIGLSAAFDEVRDHVVEALLLAALARLELGEGLLGRVRGLLQPLDLGVLLLAGTPRSPP